MPERDLDFTVLRHNRRADQFSVSADPDNIGGLQDILRAWLQRNKWHAGRWGEFSAEVRLAGQNRVYNRVAV